MGSKQEERWKELLKTGEHHATAGKLAEAEAAYTEAVATAEEDGSRQDGELVTALMHLADFYLGSKQYAKAEPVYQRGLTIYEQLHGHDTVLSVHCMRRLSEVYRAIGKLSEAKSLTERVESIGYVD